MFVLWKFWETYLAPYKSSDNENCPGIQACTAIQSPDLFLQVPTQSSPYLTTVSTDYTALLLSNFECRDCMFQVNFALSNSHRRLEFRPLQIK